MISFQTYDTSLGISGKVSSETGDYGSKWKEIWIGFWKMIISPSSYKHLMWEPSGIYIVRIESVAGYLEAMKLIRN